MNTKLKNFKDFLILDSMRFFIFYFISGRFQQRFTQSFYTNRSRKRKKHRWLDWIFAFLGSARVKASRKHVGGIDPRNIFDEKNLFEWYSCIFCTYFKSHFHQDKVYVIVVKKLLTTSSFMDNMKNKFFVMKNSYFVNLIWFYEVIIVLKAV